MDFVITPADYEGLARRYPTICATVGRPGCAFSSSRSGRHLPARYDDLALGAIAAEGYRIISLERLLLLKAFGYKVEKYRRDLELIATACSSQYTPWWAQLSPEQQAHYRAGQA